MLEAPHFDLLWGAPFAGMLLSIALGPLIAPRAWHHHQGKIALAWALLVLVPLALVQGPAAAVHEAAHAVLAEYLPFVILLGTLYVVAGGIHVSIDAPRTPALNTALLAGGTLLASLIGTTGAAMLLIRPLLAANAHRRDAAHLVVFYLFLVANAGGALSPLGDPPLFVGFLQGVPFFWTTRHLAAPTALLCATLLVIFHLVERHRAGREPIAAAAAPAGPAAGLGLRIRMRGLHNLVLLVLAALAVLSSGLWTAGRIPELLGVPLALPSLARDLALLAIAAASLILTGPSIRAANGFGWAPIAEVAKLFIGIFVTIGPVVAMLKQGEAGPLGAIARLAESGGQPVPILYFWLTGLLSAFLDNVPTYLVFFNLAGGDAAQLTGPLSRILAAVSCGAVYMGALTYIGNAPNLMVRAIAIERTIRFGALPM